MNYHDITKCDMLNGPGLRVVLWVSGCTNRCPGCQNPQTHDPNSGIPYDEAAEQELLEALDHNYISGLTFCGGDPFYPGNVEEVQRIAKLVKHKFPSKNIWAYSGYMFEDLKRGVDLTYFDVILDGPFIINLKDSKLHWVGSSNQRIIDVKKSLEANQIVLEESIYE